MNRVAADRPIASVVVALGFQVWLFVFVAFAGTTLLFTHPALRAGAQVLFALPVLVWALLRIRGPMHLLDLAMIAGITAHLAVAIASLDPQGSLEASGIVVVYAGTFWLARHIDSRPQLRRVGVVAIVMALLFWSVVIGATWVIEKVDDVRILGWPPRLHAHQPYVWGSINTPPVLILLAAPFIAWLPAGGFRRWIVVVWVASAIVIVPFSVGRAAWVGMIVALLATEVIFGFPLGRRALRAVRGGSHVVRIAAATVGLAAIVMAIGIGTRIDSVLGVIDSRIRLWQQAMGLFAADPLTGSGPSTYAWARLTQVRDFEDRVGAAYTHNVLIQTLADGGLILGVSLLAVAVAWVALIVHRRARFDPPRRIAAATVIGYAGVGMFDDLSFLPAITVLVVVLAAWSIPPPASLAPIRGLLVGARGRVVPAVLTITVVLALPGVIAINSSRIGSQAARQLAFAGDLDGALQGFERSAELQPSSALHWMSIGLLEFHAGNADASRAAYARARALSPGDPRPWGALAVFAREPSAQAELLKEAAHRSNDPQYAYRLADLLLASGDRAGGLWYLAVADAIRPGLFATLPLDLRPDVRSVLPEAVATVGSIAGRDANLALWNADLAFGDVRPGAPAAWRAMASLAAGRLDEAARLIARARHEAPHDPRTYEAAEAVARATCNRGAFEEARTARNRLGGVTQERGHGIIERPAGVYFEQELGDYQPLTGFSVPIQPPWPEGLIEVRDCGW